MSPDDKGSGVPDAQVPIAQVWEFTEDIFANPDEQVFVAEPGREILVRVLPHAHRNQGIVRAGICPRKGADWTTVYEDQPLVMTDSGYLETELPLGANVITFRWGEQWENKDYYYRGYALPYKEPSWSTDAQRQKCQDLISQLTDKFGDLLKSSKNMSRRLFHRVFLIVRVSLSTAWAAAWDIERTQSFNWDILGLTDPIPGKGIWCFSEEETIVANNPLLAVGFDGAVLKFNDMETIKGEIEGLLSQEFPDIDNKDAYLRVLKGYIFDSLLARCGVDAVTEHTYDWLVKNPFAITNITVLNLPHVTPEDRTFLRSYVLEECTELLPLVAGTKPTVWHDGPVPSKIQNMLKMLGPMINLGLEYTILFNKAATPQFILSHRKFFEDRDITIDGSGDELVRSVIRQWHGRVSRLLGLPEAGSYLAECSESGEELVSWSNLVNHSRSTISKEERSLTAIMELLIGYTEEEAIARGRTGGGPETVRQKTSYLQGEEAVRGALESGEDVLYAIDRFREKPLSPTRTHGMSPNDRGKAAQDEPAPEQSVTIEEARVEDVDAIVELWAEHYLPDLSQPPLKPPSSDDKEAYTQHICQLIEGTFEIPAKVFIARIDGRIVGYAVAYLPEPSACEIDAIAGHRDFRRRRVATKLLDHLLSWLEDKTEVKYVFCTDETRDGGMDRILSRVGFVNREGIPYELEGVTYELEINRDSSNTGPPDTAVEDTSQPQNESTEPPHDPEGKPNTRHRGMSPDTSGMSPNEPFPSELSEDIKARISRMQIKGEGKTHFLFELHDYPKMLEDDLKQDIGEADIIVVESSPEYMDIFNAVSSGELTEEEGFQKFAARVVSKKRDVLPVPIKELGIEVAVDITINELYERWIRTFFQSVHGTNKLIVCALEDMDDETMEIHDDAKALLNRSEIEFFRQGNPELLAEAAEEYCRECARFFMKRDDSVKDLLRGLREIAPRANILITRGSVHTEPFITLVKEAKEDEAKRRISRKFPVKPFTFDHMYRIIRRFIFEKPIENKEERYLAYLKVALFDILFKHYFIRQEGQTLQKYEELIALIEKLDIGKEMDRITEFMMQHRREKDFGDDLHTMLEKTVWPRGRTSPAEGKDDRRRTRGMSPNMGGASPNGPSPEQSGRNTRRRAMSPVDRSGAPQNGLSPEKKTQIVDAMQLASLREVRPNTVLPVGVDAVKQVAFRVTPDNAIINLNDQSSELRVFYSEVAKSVDDGEEHYMDGDEDPFQLVETLCAPCVGIMFHGLLSKRTLVRHDLGHYFYEDVIRMLPKIAERIGEDPGNIVVYAGGNGVYYGDDSTKEIELLRFEQNRFIRALEEHGYSMIITAFSDILNRSVDTQFDPETSTFNIFETRDRRCPHGDMTIADYVKHLEEDKGAGSQGTAVKDTSESQDVSTKPPHDPEGKPNTRRRGMSPESRVPSPEDKTFLRYYILVECPELMPLIAGTKPTVWHDGPVPSEIQDMLRMLGPRINLGLEYTILFNKVATPQFILSHRGFFEERGIIIDGSKEELVRSVIQQWLGRVSTLRELPDAKLYLAELSEFTEDLVTWFGLINHPRSFIAREAWSLIAIKELLVGYTEEEAIARGKAGGGPETVRQKPSYLQGEDAVRGALESGEDVLFAIDRFRERPLGSTRHRGMSPVDRSGVARNGPASKRAKLVDLGNRQAIRQMVKRGVTYEEALEWRRLRLEENVKTPIGFRSNFITTRNMMLVILDSVIPGFKQARESSDIREMAELYRIHVLNFRGDKARENGQREFFAKHGLIINTRKLSPDGTIATLIQLVLPSLINDENPDALKVSEVSYKIRKPKYKEPEHVERCPLTRGSPADVFIENEAAYAEEVFRDVFELLDIPEADAHIYIQHKVYRISLSDIAKQMDMAIEKVDASATRTIRILEPWIVQIEQVIVGHETRSSVLNNIRDSAEPPHEPEGKDDRPRRRGMSPESKGPSPESKGPSPESQALALADESAALGNRLLEAGDIDAAVDAYYEAYEILERLIDQVKTEDAAAGEIYIGRAVDIAYNSLSLSPPLQERYKDALGGINILIKELRQKMPDNGPLIDQLTQSVDTLCNVFDQSFGELIDTVQKYKGVFLRAGFGREELINPCVKEFEKVVAEICNLLDKRDMGFAEKVHSCSRRVVLALERAHKAAVIMSPLPIFMAPEGIPQAYPSLSDMLVEVRKDLEREDIPGFRIEQVIEAMRRNPREEFVPERSKGEAYINRPLEIGERQTISQPIVVGHNTALLKLKGDEIVLEVGVGCGWQLALLNDVLRIARESSVAEGIDRPLERMPGVGPGEGEEAVQVYGVEIRPELAAMARQNLDEAGHRNVVVIEGNGAEMLFKEEFFDRILVSAAAKDVPPALERQLKDGGILLMPIQSEIPYMQHLKLYRKKNGRLEVERVVGPIRFVPLISRSELEASRDVADSESAGQGQDNAAEPPDADPTGRSSAATGDEDDESHSRRARGMSPEADLSEKAARVREILLDWKNRPEPSEVAEFSEEDIRKGAQSAFAMGEDEIEDIYRSIAFYELENALPYVRKMVMEILEGPIDKYNKILICGRDAEIFYDALKTLLADTPQEEKIAYFPGSKELMRNLQTLCQDPSSDITPLYEFLERFGITIQLLTRGETSLLIDTGFFGSIGRLLLNILEAIYKAETDSELTYDPVHAKLVSRIFPQTSYPISVFQQFAIRQDRLKEMFPRTTDFLKQHGRHEEIQANECLAVFMQLLPHYTEHYVALEGVTAVPDRREKITTDLDSTPKFRNESIVNPVAAMLVQKRVIEYFKGAADTHDIIKRNRGRMFIENLPPITFTKETAKGEHLRIAFAQTAKAGFEENTRRMATIPFTLMGKLGKDLPDLVIFPENLDRKELAPDNSVIDEDLIKERRKILEGVVGRTGIAVGYCVNTSSPAKDNFGSHKTYYYIIQKNGEDVTVRRFEKGFFVHRHRSLEERVFPIGKYRVAVLICAEAGSVERGIDSLAGELASYIEKSNPDLIVIPSELHGGKPLIPASKVYKRFQKPAVCLNLASNAGESTEGASYFVYSEENEPITLGSHEEILMVDIPHDERGYTVKPDRGRRRAMSPEITQPVVVTQPQAQNLLTQDASMLLKLSSEYLPAEFIAGRHYQLRINASRDSIEYKIAKVWWDKVQEIYKESGATFETIKPNGSKNKEWLINVNCYKKRELIAESYVGVNHRRSPHVLMKAYYIAFAAGNIEKDTENWNGEYSLLIDFINDQYRMLTGREDNLIDKNEEPQKIIQRISEDENTKESGLYIELPPIDSIEFDMELLPEMAEEALRAV
ncbi:GNAT family N-acetyltransferase [Omnitrophica bacterium]|nr:GNAT family N-acetyltransferase [Candidatus Omnitrophota bacterium]